MVWDLDPVSATIFGRDIYWYGIMMACGILHGGWFMIRLLEAGQQAFFFRLASAGTVCAVMFARLAHFAIYDPAALTISPELIFAIRSHPGWSSHGAVIGLVLSVALLARVTKGIDAAILLGQCFVGMLAVAAWVRIGNFFQSEIVGTPSTVPWAIVFAHLDKLPRHPVQLYEALGYFMLFFLFKRQLRGALIPGNRLFLVLGLVLSLFRFLVEFFKESPQIEVFRLSLTAGQWASAGTGIACAVALAAWFWIGDSIGRKRNPRV